MQQTSTSHIKAKRLGLGWTLRDLAAQCEAAGVRAYASQLSRYERGLAMPRPAVRAVLARLLELDVADFETEAKRA